MKKQYFGALVLVVALLIIIGVTRTGSVNHSPDTSSLEAQVNRTDYATPVEPTIAKTDSSLTASTETNPVEETKTGLDATDVRKLQEDLANLKYYTDRITGTYGPATRQAVISFQERNGLDQTGLSDAKTLAVIQSKLRN